MAIAIIPAHEITLAEQANVFREAFAGYVGGSLEMDVAALAGFLRTQGIDLCYSRFAQDSEGLCGFGLITRVGDVSRLSGMGVIARARRKGVARKLLLRLLEEASARDDHAMVLEVIEQNPPAVSLYRSENFCQVARLFGWRLKQDALISNTTAPRAPAEISALTGGQMPASLEFPGLPWQISRHAIVRLTNPRAYASDRALVVVDDSGSEKPIRICALSSRGSDQPDWQSIRELFAAVIHRFYRARELFAPPIFPEIFGEEVFVPLGFLQEPLRQFLLRRDL